MNIFHAILILLAIAGIYLIRRRRFNRRNMAGVEEFRNYEQATFIRLAERLAVIFCYLLILGTLVHGCIMKPAMEKAKERSAIETQTTPGN